MSISSRSSKRSYPCCFTSCMPVNHCSTHTLLLFQAISLSTSVATWETVTCRMFNIRHLFVTNRKFSHLPFCLSHRNKCNVNTLSAQINSRRKFTQFGLLLGFGMVTAISIFMCCFLFTFLRCFVPRMERTNTKAQQLQLHSRWNVPAPPSPVILRHIGSDGLHP